MVREPDATRQPTPHDNQLMSKHRVLSFKPQLRLEWRGQDGQNETEQPDHSASLGDSITSSTRIRFSVQTLPILRPRARQCPPRFIIKCPLMSVRGHSRRCNLEKATSGLSQSTDIVAPASQVRFVPGTDMMGASRTKGTPRDGC
jgi:hypothetical protein